MTESPLRPPLARPEDFADDDDDGQDQQLPHDKPDDDFGPFEVDSPERPARGTAGSARQQQQQQAQLSFANPGDRNKLYEQLSAKMVPIDPKTMLTVSSDEGKGRRGGGAMRRASRSADPSPRWGSRIVA